MRAKAWPKAAAAPGPGHWTLDPAVARVDPDGMSESTPETTPDITTTHVQEQPTASVREKVPMNAITEFFGRAFTSVMAAVEQQGLQPAGPPFGMYRGVPTDMIDVEAGFPLAAPLTGTNGDSAGVRIDGGHGESQVAGGVLPAGPAYEALHVGPYDTLRQTYEAIMARMQADGATPGEAMWEFYLTDPDAEPDPGKWQTRIIWPTA